jgi:lipoprotein-releasing system permease protein
MFHVWMTLRFILSRKYALSVPSILSLIGMTTGVACLVAAMGVVSGFEATLAKTITDVYGHVLVINRSTSLQDIETTADRIAKAVPQVRAYTPFVNVEGVIAHKAQLSGIVLQGLDPKSVDDVLNLKNRVIKGEFKLNKDGEYPSALVGKGIQRRFKIEIGDTFQIVLPSPEVNSASPPKVQKFILRGVLDLGKNEYDERYIVTSLKSAQAFLGIGDAFSGIRIRLSDEKLAPTANLKIARELGNSYFVNDWTEVNKNLFEAVQLERIVIFFVILIIVIAAAFNISSQLYVGVLQRFSDISILKAIGATPRDIKYIFTLNGLFFGVIGTALGIVLGLILCGLFIVVQKYSVIMPVDVYKIDNVGIDIRLIDITSIVGSALVICLLSSLMPAVRGSKLNPVEGLRYE